MRRHSLGPESLRKQIISVFTPSSRKRQNSTNNEPSSHAISNTGRRTRRYSVPNKKYLDSSNNNGELHTINELRNTSISDDYEHVIENIRLTGLIMTCDRRNTLFAPVNTFNFTSNDRVRRYSTPDKQDLETIYEILNQTLL
ncbi:unnamed protein product [Adineta steineri]|uniref:Uncharacterized protein n=1 Tax=Adineta steineri TaxID=433720 RepID=A0A816ADB4_9BILA|nr:unnamed protein product [Adineta steineri]CAF1596242.1 unnamed protein product [Adineta steineri]